MKRGKKKTGSDEAGSRNPEPEGPGKKNTESGESGSFRVTSDMIGGNPNGTDALRTLQIIAVVIALIFLIWLVFHRILQLF